MWIHCFKLSQYSVLYSDKRKISASVYGLEGAGCSSGSRTPICIGLDHMIDPAWRCICSLGYFPFQPVVHQRLFCLWESAYKDPLLLIGKHSQSGDIEFPQRKYGTMTICLTSRSQYENQSALEALLTFSR